MTFRSLLYWLARLLGDIEATLKSRVDRRIARRTAGKLKGSGSHKAVQVTITLWFSVGITARKALSARNVKFESALEAAKRGDKRLFHSRRDQAPLRYGTHREPLPTEDYRHFLPGSDVIPRPDRSSVRSHSLG
jgi:hypothetical protein